MRRLLLLLLLLGAPASAQDWLRYYPPTNVLVGDGSVSGNWTVTGGTLTLGATGTPGVLTAPSTAGPMTFNSATATTGSANAYVFNVTGNLVTGECVALWRDTLTTVVGCLTGTGRWAFGSLVNGTPALEPSGDDLVFLGGDGATPATTAQFVVGPGAVGTPSLTGSDSDTGIWLNTSNQVRLVAGGVHQWTVSSTALTPATTNTEDLGTSSVSVQSAFISTSTQSSRSKVLTDNTATAFVRVSVADDDYEGVRVNYTVYAEDAEGDARQVRTGTADFAILNNSGTEACGTVTPSDTVAVTAGTLTVAFDCNSASADTMDLRVTANTSLDAAAETLTIEYRVNVTSGTSTVTAQ